MRWHFCLCLDASSSVRSVSCIPGTSCFKSGKAGWKRTCRKVTRGRRRGFAVRCLVYGTTATVQRSYKQTGVLVLNHTRARSVFSSCQIALILISQIEDTAFGYGAILYGPGRGAVRIPIVTCPLKARIIEADKISVARQWLCEHDVRATKSRDRRNRYTRNNRGTVGGGVLCWVHAEAI
jgi:hypothetical protein